MNDAPEMTRYGRKTRKHLMMSYDLIGALDTLLADDVSASEFVEAATWAALVDEFGRSAVLDAIDATQAEMDDDERLVEPKEVDSLPSLYTSA